MRRVIALSLVLVGTAALAGCPRGTPPPDRMGGMPCETTADCNPDRTCGAMAVCVTGLCESGHTLVVPCPGMGERPSP